MKEKLINSIDFSEEEYNERMAVDNRLVSFNQFIDNVLLSVKENNGTLEDAIYIANDAFDKL